MCNCNGPYNKDFKCAIHWHNKETCDETMRYNFPVDERITDNRLRTILHNFGYSIQRPDMYSCVSEREGVHMAFELLSLRAQLNKQ